MTQEHNINTESSDLRNVKVTYDDIFDILYIDIGPPTNASTKPINDGIYLRREIGTERIASVTVERYSKRDRDCLLKLLPPLIREDDLPSIKTDYDSE